MNKKKNLLKTVALVLLIVFLFWTGLWKLILLVLFILFVCWMMS